MLRPYVPKPYEREHASKKTGNKADSKSGADRRVLALQKLARLHDQAKSIRTELGFLKDKFQPFEWLLPVQYRKYFPSSKQNQSGSGNATITRTASTSKYHLSETAVGAALIENNANKSQSAFRLPPKQPSESTDDKQTLPNIREKILRQLDELKGLQKRENIVRCINESRAKFPSKPPAENTRSSFDSRPSSRAFQFRATGVQDSQPECPSGMDLAYSTVSIITSSCPNNPSRAKPSSLVCPERHEYYSGDIQDGVPHGRGRLVVCCPSMPYSVSSDTQFYNGAFEKGKFHGLGTLSLKGGVKYVGSFKDGLREGEGSLYSNGNVDVCVWSRDKIQQRL